MNYLNPLCDCNHNPLQVFKGRPPSHTYFSHKPSLPSPMVPGNPWISRKRDLSVPGTTRQLRDLAVIGDLRKCGRTFSCSPAPVKPRPQTKESAELAPINLLGANIAGFSTIASAIALMRGLLFAHFFVVFV